MSKHREQFSSLSCDQKIEMVWSMHIATKEANRIKANIESCHKSFHRRGEKKNLFISGSTGAGKTTACRLYESLFPRGRNKEGDAIIPVLYSTVFTPARVKPLASSLLACLGDPLSEKGTVLTMTNRILKFLKECSVEIIILDEFQHFIDRNSEVVLKEVADWLKQLIDSARIPIVLVGLPESEYVLKENKQLSRRFSQRCSLDPFPFEKQVDRKAFRKVLATLDSLLPLSKDSNLSSGDMPERFFYASDGFIAYIAKLLRFAAEFAIETGLQNLNRGVLAKVFHEQIHPDKPGKDNPFLPDKFDISYDELVKSQKDILLNKMNKRIKSKKPKRNLNDVF